MSVVFSTLSSAFATSLSLYTCPFPSLHSFPFHIHIAENKNEKRGSGRKRRPLTSPSSSVPLVATWCVLITL
ncbi:hypothetical protein HanPSC8_Chr08g0337711 [Helianthus annuus]|nr:hypothetical protein HanPSC8_Chr08g0337711 [Helianthus annuus]